MRGVLPTWPADFPCEGSCGFETAGLGLECRDGDACGRYLHPGDEHHDTVRAYYDEARTVSPRFTSRLRVVR